MRETTIASNWNVYFGFLFAWFKCLWDNEMLMTKQDMKILQCSIYMYNNLITKVNKLAELLFWDKLSPNKL